MGISGLLPALKSYHNPIHIQSYAGMTVAIDGYCWLHRGVYSCSSQLARGIPTTKYLNYCLNMVKMLLHYGVTPYLVFDGAYLPAKAGTESGRRESRDRNRELGMQKLREGDSNAAAQYFVKAVDVTPQMAWTLIQELKKLNVQYVVAPYEADAQLAFLCREGIVDAVISEDSDCLPYGCQRVLFKLDNSGHGMEINLPDAMQKKGFGDFALHGFTQEMFLDMCILSGCDYLPSLTGIGIKKAYQYIRAHKQYLKVVRRLQLEGKIRVPSSYLSAFVRARMTFKHQCVYDPRTKELSHLAPLTEELIASVDADLSFLGSRLIDGDIARAIAEGAVDPISHQPLATAALEDSGQSEATADTTVSPESPCPAVRQHSIQSFFQAVSKPESHLRRRQSCPPAPQLLNTSPAPKEERLTSSALRHTEEKKLNSPETKATSKYFSTSPSPNKTPLYSDLGMEDEEERRDTYSDEDRTTNETQSPLSSEIMTSRDEADDSDDSQANSAPTKTKPSALQHIKALKSKREDAALQQQKASTRGCFRVGLSRSFSTQQRVTYGSTTSSADTVRTDSGGIKRSFAFLDKHRFSGGSPTNDDENEPEEEEDKPKRTPTKSSTPKRSATATPAISRLRRTTETCIEGGPAPSERMQAPRPPLAELPVNSVARDTIENPALSNVKQSRLLVPATPSPAKGVLDRREHFSSLNRFSFGAFTPPVARKGCASRLGQSETEKNIVPETPSPALNSSLR